MERKGTNTGKPGTLKKFPRYFESQSEEGENNPLDFKFSQSVKKPVQQVQPEENPLFWSENGVHTAGSSLQIRRYGSGSNDNIYIQRLNTNGPPSRFKFPSSMLHLLVTRMKMLMYHVVEDENRKPYMKNLPPYTGKLNFTDDFWNSEHAIKIMRFNLMPYNSKYGLTIRMWQKIPAEYYKTYECGDGTTIEWRGCCISISYSTFREMYRILEEINANLIEVHESAEDDCDDCA